MKRKNENKGTEKENRVSRVEPEQNSKRGTKELKKFPIQECLSGKRE